ncbi:adenosylcobinamide-GDP ribazoletransferase [Acuticoccus sp. I52.16.1]|uniref:adenosylcobinamide-GDP ribazoletransferase n=1 Tax=Acuticoccus sp. I52.16.1 TaxID=2928472 RepID=UPI001FD52ACB|nr:adenosylcobinamide-GDP ribazoletransferase [Acuticoccus sp. I52.16.1]UOM34646.1 adenosylcobinamide-GDP ribazoletransferase [Acuticoccus sp. I52.16.1]
MTPWRPALGAVIGFYSRLPVPIPADVTLARCVWILPAATVVIAWPAAVAGGLAWWLGLAPLAAALVASLALAVTTGALHEDGLADCADGFWGAATIGRRLEIMRDSRIGTYGVLALVGAVGLKAALLAQLFERVGGWALVLFIAAAVAGRAVALFPWAGLPNARTGGLAASAGRPTGNDFRTAMLMALAITAVLTLWVSPLGFILAGLTAAGSAKAVASLADAKIGGHTGDVIGAAVILGDLSYLAGFTISLA